MILAMEIAPGMVLATLLKNVVLAGAQVQGLAPKDSVCVAHVSFSLFRFETSGKVSKLSIMR